MDNCTKMMDSALKQGLIKWEPKVGDWTQYGVIYGEIFDYDDRERMVEPVYRIAIDENTVSSNYISQLIWLPSIEQLMGMVHTDKTEWGKQIRFINWGNKQHVETCVSAKMSIKELWLAFVIHKNHNKKWSQEKGEWIK